MLGNPLAWLHVQLYGGRTTNGIVLLVYVALIVVGTSVSYSMTAPQDHGQIAAVWLGIMAGAQALFLLLIVPGQVRKSVLRDHTSGMIESHRMTPIGSLNLASGYLLGAAIQMLMLFAVNIIAGSYFAAKVSVAVKFAQAPVGWWFLQFCIVCLSFMLSSMALTSALASAGKANIAGLIVFMSAVGGWMVLSVVPGTALLLGVMGGFALFQAIQSGAAPSTGTIVPISCALQVAFGAIFLRAACRRIRSPERPSFSVELGLVLALLWGATLLAGLYMSETMPRAVMERANAPARLFASTGAFLAGCLVPLFSAAVSMCQMDRATILGDEPARKRRATLATIPFVLGIVTMVVALVGPLMFHAATSAASAPAGPPGAALAVQNTFALPGSVSSSREIAPIVGLYAQPWRRLGIGLAFLLSFWTDFNLIYRGSAIGKNGVRVAFFWILFLKLLPFLPDMSLMTYLKEFENKRVALPDLYTTGISPFGTMVLAADKAGNLWPGLAVQVLIAAAATYFAIRAKTRLTPEVRPAPTPAPTPLV